MTKFGVILGPFCPNLDKNEFSWKKGLSQFSDIPITYHRAKTEEPFLRERPNWRTDQRTNRQTDRPTDRQTDRQTNGDL